MNYFYNTGVVETHDKTQAIRELLSGERIEPGLCNKLFRKELFQCWRMDESIRINEDLLMNFYLFSAAEQTVFEDWCPYHYIVREGSASRTKLNEHKIYDPIIVKKVILENCDDGILVDAKSAFMTTCVYIYCGLLMEQGVEEHLAAVRKEIVSHQEWVMLLPKRTKLLAELAIRMPTLLRHLYPVYAQRFQCKKYD